MKGWHDAVKDIWQAIALALSRNAAYSCGTAEPRLRAVMEGLQQRANEGEWFFRSMGLSVSYKGTARAEARRLEIPAYPHQEPAAFSGAIGNDG